MACRGRRYGCATPRPLYAISAPSATPPGMHDPAERDLCRGSCHPLPSRRQLRLRRLRRSQALRTRRSDTVCRGYPCCIWTSSTMQAARCSDRSGWHGAWSCSCAVHGSHHDTWKDGAESRAVTAGAWPTRTRGAVRPLTARHASSRVHDGGEPRQREMAICPAVHCAKVMPSHEHWAPFSGKKNGGVFFAPTDSVCRRQNGGALLGMTPCIGSSLCREHRDWRILWAEKPASSTPMLEPSSRSAEVALP